MTRYFLGHSALELHRLAIQATILHPVTERLLQAIPLKTGMHVLDVGCGPGDVAFLAAKRVGPTGRVVGIDRAAAAIALAQARARLDNVRNVHFQTSSVSCFAARRQFDVVIGRYVLLHQAHPAQFIKSAARLVCPGGIVAFHELDVYGEFVSFPVVETFRQASACLMQVLREHTLSPDAGRYLTALFAQAGLPEPVVFCERPMGRVCMAEWLAIGLATLQRRIGESALSVDFQTSVQRLASDALALHSQVSGPDQYCAWTHVSPVHDGE